MRNKRKTVVKVALSTAELACVDKWRRGIEREYGQRVTRSTAISALGAVHDGLYSIHGLPKAKEVEPATDYADDSDNAEPPNRGN